jgi:hypothetical protein
MKSKTQYELTNIESRILSTSDNQKKSWLLIGQYLCLVEKYELFTQNENYTSYSKWLNFIAKKIDLQSSTLWKYKKIVIMINELKLPPEKINIKNVTGLEQISRIFGLTKNSSQALSYINLLNDKQLNITDLKSIYKNLLNKGGNIVLKEDVISEKPSLSTKINNFIHTILLTENMLKTSSIILIILTITPIK